MLVLRVLVCAGCWGYGAGLHVVVGLLRVQGVRVGVWAWGCGC